VNRTPEYITIFTVYNIRYENLALSSMFECHLLQLDRPITMRWHNPKLGGGAGNDKGS
jgi:hypothetical protein